MNKSRPIGYSVYNNMIARCYKTYSHSYHRYGQRGIKVCDRWRKSFKNFIEDMGKPKKGESIDRIDNNGDYCKENCRWSSKKEQSNNRRSNHPITFNGRTQNITQWADELGIKRTTLMMRINSYGWSIEDALS